MLVPVFSLRREDDLGIGDTRCLRQLIDWAVAHRVGFLQLLPINETGEDNSPYNAISSVALDPVLLNMEAIPGVGRSELRRVAEKYGLTDGGGDLVCYQASGDAKRELLREGYRAWVSQGLEGEALNEFCEQEADWLEAYCKYRYLMEVAGTEHWEQWPEAFNRADKAEAYLADCDSEALEYELRYYAWVQWHAFSQWRELRQYAQQQDVKLMGDIPIGISYSSADVFFEPQWFDLKLSGGSPPETVFKDDAFACQWGQNWGIPLYDWEALAADGYRWWRRRIEKLIDVFHIFRIDHILGFYRIYSFPWRPSDNPKFLGLSKEEAEALTDGVLPCFSPRDDESQINRDANLADGDRYLKVIQEAAGDSEVVGEDLGCVPDYVRPHLARRGIAGFKICHWEEERAGIAVKGADYPSCAFATYATHDHDPIPALWNSLVDMLGGLEHEGAVRGLSLLSDFAGLPKGDTINTYAKYGPVVKWALLGALLKSNADYAAVMITDLIDSEKRINVPGTVGGENWRYRLPWALDDMPSKLQAECSRLRALVRVSDRG